jgi:peptidoglycan-associated lipoprotein
MFSMKPGNWAALLVVMSLAGCATTETATAPESTPTPPPAVPVKDASGPATYGAGDDSVSGNVRGSAEAVARDQQLAAQLQQAVVYFDFDKSNIRPDAYEILNAHSAYLSSNPAARIRLEGHADERGTREYNMALGERRGNAAANYMSARGVARAQVEVISYGEERPAVMGANEAAWAQNRRVVIEYTTGAPR